MSNGEGGMQKYYCFNRVQKIEKRFINSMARGLRFLASDEIAKVKRDLKERKILLNKSCPSTEENLKKFWEVTEKLEKLLRKNHERLTQRTLDFLSSPVSDGKSNLCWISSRIEIATANPLDSLTDDELYGSNFFLMRKLLSEAGQHLMPVIGNGQYGCIYRYFDGLVDDSEDWKFEDDNSPTSGNHLSAETKESCPWLYNYWLNIPPIASELLDTNYFSVPDYLRLGQSLTGMVEWGVQYDWMS